MTPSSARLRSWLLVLLAASVTAIGLVAAAQVLPVRRFSLVLFGEHRRLFRAVMIASAVLCLLCPLVRGRALRALAWGFPLLLLSWIGVNLTQFGSIDSDSAWQITRRPDNSLHELMLSSRDRLYDRVVLLFLSEQFRGRALAAAPQTLVALHLTTEQIRHWGRAGSVDKRHEMPALTPAREAALSTRTVTTVMGSDGRRFRFVTDGAEPDARLDLVLGESDAWIVPHDVWGMLEPREP